MNSKTWINRALSTCLIITTIVAYSMVALANTKPITGELLISGNDKSGVMVNGEVAGNGHSVFSSNTITTSENKSAIVKVGKLGSLELAPGTTLTIMFNEKGINGKLAAGKVTVLNAADSVNIITPEGNLNKLDAGDSVVAAKTQDDDDDDDDTGGALLIGLGVFGAALAGALFAAFSGGDGDVNFDRPNVSPIR